MFAARNSTAIRKVHKMAFDARTDIRAAAAPRDSTGSVHCWWTNLLAGVAAPRRERMDLMHNLLTALFANWVHPTLR